MKRVKSWMMAAILFCGSASVMAQETSGQFSVATLNVDGLPTKVLVFKINADGPGDSGSARIGKYLLQKGYDLMFLQEDFNYHDIINVFVEDDYKFDTWSGNVGLDGHTIDFLHLQNHRYECDGLMTYWKNDLTVTPAPRVAWQQSFGKFSHANDEMVTKGFRRYEVTLRDGTRIICYNMHMDASDDKDEEDQNDGKDKAARMAQWTQLKADIMSKLDTRPIIITGDMNSFYGRDAVKTQFIDAINDSGLGTVSDVWVELKNGGTYPTENPQGEGTVETLDKILYINPTTGTKIKPVAYTLDKTGYMYDDKPLGDHYPVAATFQVVSKGSGIDNVTSLIENEQMITDKTVYNLKGQRISQPQGGIYIERQGETFSKRIIK